MITSMTSLRAVVRCGLCRQLIRKADAKISPKTGHWLCCDVIRCARAFGVIVPESVAADYYRRHDDNARP